MINKIQEFTADDDILGVAVTTKDMFYTLNSNFACVHSLISKAQPISEVTILQAESAIAEYIKFFRQCFPNCNIPKQHILEKHSTDFMHRTDFGLGFLREQGGEQLHSTVSCLSRRSAAIRNDKNRMKNILENALLLTAPELNALVLQTKPREQQK